MSRALCALTLTATFCLVVLIGEARAQVAKGKGILCRETCGAETFKCLRQAEQAYQEASKKKKPDPAARENKSKKGHECIARRKDCFRKCPPQ